MEAVLGPLFPLAFVAFFVLERLARRHPFSGRWTVVGVLFFLSGAVVNGLVPGLVGPALARLAPVDLSGLGLLGGVPLAFWATTFADYWLHRAMHASPLLWRWTHQLHHAAERVDIPGFAYSHPFELVLSVLLATVVGSLLGVSADAVALAGFLFFLTQLFLHTDIRTPTWIGVLLQRPEAHRLHHTREVHAYNYGLPLWDALFGTRRNPVAWDETYGFWDGASSRMGAMLLGRDVAKPAA